MKKLLVLGLLLVSVLGFSQTKRQSIMDEEIDKIICKYQKITYVDKNEIIYMVYVGFQNQEYSSIVDTKGFGFFKQETLTNFIKDLKSVEAQMLLKEKVNIDWTKDNYKLELYDFNPNYLYLRNVKGVVGYTTISLKTLSKIIEKLSLIDFGKDNLKSI